VNRDEAYQACLSEVKNELAAKVITDKYLLCDNDKNYIESKPSQMWRRLAEANAKAEKKSDYNKYVEKFYNALADFKFVPAGRVLYGLGNPYVNVTLKNCYVLAPQEDSLEGIFDLCKNMAVTYKSGGGVGIDISLLRPKGMPVRNAARESTGSVSFMDLFSNITGMIGQKARIGALLISIAVDHPDVFDFITVKGSDNLDKVRFANISLRIKDEFMQAVLDDLDFPLKWGGKIFKTVKARELWNMIVHYAWKRAEPGILFWDNILKESTPDQYEKFKTITTNPCLTGDMKLLTSNGYKTLHELWIMGGCQEYDGEPSIRKYGRLEIINSNGTAQATNVYRTSKSSKIYRIILQDNTYIDATNTHKFILIDESRKTLAELKVGDELAKLDPNIKSIIKSIKQLNEQETFCLTEPFCNEIVIKGVRVGNCGEATLSYGDSCNLGSMNLGKYVRNSFEDNCNFDYESFDKDVRIAIRFLDNIITLEKCPLEFQQWANDNGRRLGLGVMGLADVFMRMKLRYDSEEAIQLSDKIMSSFMFSSYDESCELAKEKGAFPLFDVKKHLQSEYSKRLPQSIKDKIQKTGMRNIACHAIAPTGSLQCIAQCSGAIEPVFNICYIRKTNLGTAKKVEEHEIWHSTAKEYSDKYKVELKNLPKYFVGAHDIDPYFRIKLQSRVGKYVDQAISNTLNLSSDCTEEQISKLYIEAWRNGLKGITIYRDGSREGVLSNKKEDSQDEILVHNAPKRPESLEAIAHVIKPNGKKFTVFVGMLKGRVYEVFALDHTIAGVVDGMSGQIIREKGKDNKNIYHFESGAMLIRKLNGHEDNEASLVTRLISTALRHGTPLEFIIDQITKSKVHISSFAKAIARTLAIYVKQEDIKGKFKCSECGSSNVKIEGTCFLCLDCQFSRCT